MSYAAIKGKLNGNTDAAGRIYLLVAPQGAKLPYIVMQRISGGPAEETFDGPTDLEPGRYQVTYWTEDPKGLPAAEKAIRAALAQIDEDSFLVSLGHDEEPPASGEARAYASRFEIEVWERLEV